MTNTMNGFLSRLMSDQNQICSVAFNTSYVCQSSKEQSFKEKVGVDDYEGSCGNW